MFKTYIQYTYTVHITPSNASTGFAGKMSNSFPVFIKFRLAEEMLKHPPFDCPQ